MKSKLMKGLVIVALAGSLTACEMDRQQRHTATGAAIGGVAGGLLGGDIATTLGGAALGGVIGSQVNKDRDYDDREYRHYKKHKRHHHHRTYWHEYAVRLHKSSPWHCTTQREILDY